MSERIYRRLLRLYPAPFRDRFAEPMLQHFRDQRRDAGQSPRSFARTRFWLGILSDVFLSVLREHISHCRQNIKTRPGILTMKRIPSFRFLFFAFLIPIMAIIIVGTLGQPRRFTATSRIVINKTGLSFAYDPYFLQTQFEFIKSNPLLTKVVTQLGLAKTMAERYRIKGPLSDAGAAQLLRNQIEILQYRDTELIEVRVVCESPAEAAAVANKIVEIYKAESALARVDLVDGAIQPTRPNRPNVPFELAIGLLVNAIFSALASAVIRLLLRKPSSVVSIL
jgi:uncharacterized protein involved in exopolysaccharide biosynthesis